MFLCFCLHIIVVKKINLALKQVILTQQCTSLINSTRFGEHIKRKMITPFNTLYASKAFIHHFYSNGLEEDDLNLATEMTRDFTE